MCGSLREGTETVVPCGCSCTENRVWHMGDGHKSDECKVEMARIDCLLASQFSLPHWKISLWSELCCLPTPVACCRLDWETGAHWERTHDCWTGCRGREGGGWRGCRVLGIPEGWTGERYDFGLDSDVSLQLALSSPPGSVCGHLGLGWKATCLQNGVETFLWLYPLLIVVRDSLDHTGSGLDIAGGQCQLLLHWAKVYLHLPDTKIFFFTVTLKWFWTNTFFFPFLLDSGNPLTPLFEHLWITTYLQNHLPWS